MGEVNVVEDRFRRWLVSWGKVVDGIVEVLTITFYSPDLTMKAARSIGRWRMRQRADRPNEEDESG